MASESKAKTTKTTFSRETAIEVDIQASPKIIWHLLTTAKDIPRWNSTVIALEGDIKPGETIALTSTLDEKRVFKLKIKEFEAEKRLVWGDAQGERVYTITPGQGDSVTVSMREKIGGLMFPLYGRFIPSFDESFEHFAADLKKEAESMQAAASTN